MGLLSGDPQARRRGVVVRLTTAQVVAFSAADIDKILTQYAGKLGQADIDRLLVARLALDDQARLVPYDCGVCDPRGGQQCGTCPAGKVRRA